MNILYCCDDAYFIYLVVSICSLLEKHRNQEIHIYIFDGGISSNNKNKLISIIESFPDKKITFIEYDESLLEDFKNISIIPKKIIYAHFLAPFYIQQEKILYLDADTIILGDILNLYNINIDEFVLAAVEKTNEIDTNLHSINQLIHYSFNAGVILFNLKNFTENVFFQLSSFGKKFPEKYKNLGNQDILNLFFHNRYLRLDQKYNTFSPSLSGSISGDPHIIQYKGGGKIMFQDTNFSQYSLFHIFFDYICRYNFFDFYIDTFIEIYDNFTLEIEKTFKNMAFFGLYDGNILSGEGSFLLYSVDFKQIIHFQCFGKNLPEYNQQDSVIFIFNNYYQIKYYFPLDDALRNSIEQTFRYFIVKVFKKRIFLFSKGGTRLFKEKMKKFLLLKLNYAQR